MSGIYKAFLEQETAVRRVLRRYFKRSEDVEDLTQETFLKCFAAETKGQIREPKAFLLRVAKNVALSEVKKKSRTTTDYLEDSSLLDVLGDDAQISADVQLDAKRKLVILTKIVANLPPDCRQALLMRKMEKLKYDQIALRLNVSLSTVHRLVGRAMLQCSAALRDQGYELMEFGGVMPKGPAASGSIITLAAGAAKAEIIGE
jgi:RNA polymerase sigma-70 factor (ECF subfamily)